MKTFVSNDAMKAHGHVTREGGLKPGKIKFLFSDIQEQLELNQAEPFMIEWNGVCFLVPFEVVENAMQREVTLAKHSEHYTHGVAFEPTYVSLDQCDALSDAAVEMTKRTKFFDPDDYKNYA
jgi:hypothetical protein